MHFGMDQARRLLKRYGIDYAISKVISLEEEEKHNLRYPLVLKVDSPEILHKSDHGLVFVGIKSPVELREKIRRAERNLKEEAVKKYSFVIQEMVEGVELLVGMKRDRAFGPVILFGLGGVFVELMKDVSMGIAPLKKRDCIRMVESIKGKKILEGYRNMPCVDKGKVIDLLMKTSSLSLNEKNIIEIDFNPVMASQDRVVVVDARVIGGRDA